MPFPFVSRQNRPGASRHLLWQQALPVHQQGLGHTGRTLQLTDGAMTKGKGSEGRGQPTRGGPGSRSPVRAW